MDVRTNQSFAWDAVLGATDYEVELSQLSGTVDKLAITTALTITVAEMISGTGVVLGNTRRVRVRARDSFGNGAWSSLLTFTLVGLEAPANLRVV